MIVGVEQRVTAEQQAEELDTEALTTISLLLDVALFQRSRAFRV